jgi:cytochrome c-type biogenesis protein
VIEQPTVEIWTAFIAGFFSFLSPCVLPLIPGYLSFISGVSIEELTSKDKVGSHYSRLLLNTVFFVFGFSVVFVLLGAGASEIGHWLKTHITIFNRVAGVLVFLFGIHVSGLLRFGALNYEKRFHLTGVKKKGIVGAFLIGLAFAFGWTPCIGPILGSILTLAAQHGGSASQGIILLSFYSAGLGIPFILTALLFTYLISTFGFIKRHFRVVEIISGSLLMLVGILMFFDMLQRVSGFILDLFPSLQNVG